MNHFAKKTLSAYERWELPVLNNQQAVAELWKKENETDAMTAFPTADELEALRSKAQEEGFAEGKKLGHEQGYALGLAEAQQEVESALMQLNQLIKALINPIAQQDEQLEQVLLTLVENICTQMIKHELALDSQGILFVVREALDKISSSQHKVKIYLHPQDYAALEKFLPQQPEYESQWRILVRETLTPGGCIVETDHLLIDATVYGRLQQVMNQLYQKKSVVSPEQNAFISKHDMLTDRPGFSQ